MLDSYLYDAFGNDAGRTGTTPNSYRFTGEPFDDITKLTYLRARWLNNNTGRFMTADPFAGSKKSPVTLNKYLYANANPTSYVDPSGNVSMFTAVGVTLATIATSVGGFFGAQAADKRDHFYFNETLICTKFETARSKCGPLLVFYHLRRFPAPGSDGSRAVKTNDESFALPVGWVRHEVNEGGLSLKNITTRFHLLDPGTVTRAVRTIGQQIFVTSEGRGNGRFAAATVETSGWLWKRVDQNIINEIE